MKNQRLGQTGLYRPTPPSPALQPSPRVLQPVVDLLQYHVFCNRVHAEVYKVVHGLRAAGIPVKCRVNRVGENGEQLIRMLTSTEGPQRVGGETLLRIDNR